MRSNSPDSAPTNAFDLARLLLIPFLALIIVLPLIFHGPSCGHDFDYHLLSWFEAAPQFAHGILHPHWAYTPAYNTGEPRFVFYPPLSWTLGGLLGLLLTHLPRLSESAAWSAAPILYTWLALTLSGLAIYRLAREFAGANAALIAAAINIANPYMLFTAYERTAYSELLAAAWIPLLLLGILRRRISIPGIALPVGLLWITNAPVSVLCSYSLASLVALRIVQELRTPEQPVEVRRHGALHLALKSIAGTLLGISLAAFYILPASVERRFVHIAMAAGSYMDVSTNFLFEHTHVNADAPLHDAVLRTASWICVTLLVATALALIAERLLRTRRDSQRNESRTAFPTLSLALLTVGFAFALTPLSLPLWKHAPQALFVQFPWRLMAILGPILALTCARLLSNLRVRFGTRLSAPSAAAVSRWMECNALLTAVIIALLFTAALTDFATRNFRQRCDPDDTAPARLALFHSNIGTGPTDEFTPLTADNDALDPTDDPPLPAPPYWFADRPDGPIPHETPHALRPVPTHFDVTAPHAEFLILYQRDYPAWRITRNGVVLAHPVLRDDGLITIPLPAGSSTIEIRYMRLPDQLAGDVLTLLALAIVLFSLRRRTEAA